MLIHVHVCNLYACRLDRLLLRVAYQQDGWDWTVDLSQTLSLLRPYQQLPLLYGMGKNNKRHEYTKQGCTVYVQIFKGLKFHVFN